jgi:hypothetical protein
MNLRTTECLPAGVVLSRQERRADSMQRSAETIVATAAV